MSLLRGFCVPADCFGIIRKNTGTLRVTAPEKILCINIILLRSFQIPVNSFYAVFTDTIAVIIADTKIIRRTRIVRENCFCMPADCSLISIISAGIICSFM